MSSIDDFFDSFEEEPYYEGSFDTKKIIEKWLKDCTTIEGPSLLSTKNGQG